MVDVNNYKKDRTVCNSCYKKLKKKNKNNTLTPNTFTTLHQQPKNEDVSVN